MRSLSKNNREASEPRTKRRARPALGTFVEITAETSNDGVDPAAAIDAAFGAVARVQRLMSFHDPKSDVSRLNRLAVRRRVTVDPSTAQVLSAALELNRASDGIFDVSIAPLLSRWRLLPQIGSNRRCSGRSADIEIDSENGIRFHAPLQIDLGGIAKGYAVDQAVAELQARGITAGVVNAGGDLRVFGQRAQRIVVRDPQAPGTFIALSPLADRALATSAQYETVRWRGTPVSAHVDGRTRTPCVERVSVSVLAPTCLWADALCKIVVADREFSARLLRNYDAEVVIVGDRRRNHAA